MDIIINLCDEYALEMAFNIKEAYKDKQTQISVFSMGPYKACEILKLGAGVQWDKELVRQFIVIAPSLSTTV